MCHFMRSLIMAAFLLFGISYDASAAEDQRQAVPDQAAREKTNKMIQEIFGPRMETAKMPQAFTELAAELSKLAFESNDDANARFVLLQFTVDLATKAGDYKLAYASAEEVANDYQVDRFVVLPRVLANLIPRATAKNYFEARLYYLGLIAEAASAERLDVATTLCEQLASLSQRYGDATAKKEVASKIVEIQTLKKSFAEMTAATKILAATPDDPAANETLGKYYLEKGKWELAFSKLALANDAGFKTLAAKATAKPDNLPEQMELADASWKLAETSKGVLQARLQQLAGHYYSKALKQATGLDKAKIEIRLKELTKKANPLPDTPGFVQSNGDPYAKRAELAQQELNPTIIPTAQPGVNPPAQAPAAKSPIKIVRARWGIENKWADITDKCKEIHGQDAGRWIWATTDMLKVDPAPGTKKKLEIQYEIDGKSYTAVIDAGKQFRPAEAIKKAREQNP